MASSDQSEVKGMLKLQASDGKVFEEDHTMMTGMSSLVSNMVEIFEKGGNADNEPLPLLNVDGDTLDLVLQWCRYHKDDPPLPEFDATEVDSEDICSWDKHLLNAPMPVIYKLVQAADYMDIQGLVLVCCKKLANKIKGKSVEDIRKTMNITNDFSPEEQQEIIKKFEWCQGIISDSASSRPSRS